MMQLLRGRAGVSGLLVSGFGRGTETRSLRTTAVFCASPAHFPRRWLRECLGGWTHSKSSTRTPFLSNAVRHCSLSLACQKRLLTRKESAKDKNNDYLPVQLCNAGCQLQSTARRVILSRARMADASNTLFITCVLAFCFSGWHIDLEP